ncbi:MAG: hypothetical protein IJI39_07895, partial [Clostridia bacterium]|nr:hypothetical protein [Clostridia bacterium]
ISSLVNQMLNEKLDFIYSDVKRVSKKGIFIDIWRANIDNVYFGAYDKKSGCAGSNINLFESGLFNYDVNVQGGVMECECAKVLTEFFKELRERKSVHRRRQ